jgi:4-hydroxy-tetrahydrodipicolinate reductase
VIRVGVLGAAGRMGRMVCRTVPDDPALELVAAVSPAHVGTRVAALTGVDGADGVVSGALDALIEARTDVAVDFTRPSAVMTNVRWLIDHGIHAVVGTTGLTEDDLSEIRSASEAAGGRANAIVVPNFAVGAVLMQRLAELAAPHMPAVEIVELHHDGKLDAPSGTALATAARIAAARSDPWSGPTAERVPGVRGGDADGIRVHSIRLPGLVAHQEVIFGSTGQTLTIRHDTTDRMSFMPGVLLAVKAIAFHPGLTVGLEPLLGL